VVNNATLSCFQDISLLAILTAYNPMEWSGRADLNRRPSEPHAGRIKGGDRLPPFQNYYRNITNSSQMSTPINNLNNHDPTIASFV
jgi:hypothetical protein